MRNDLYPKSMQRHTGRGILVPGRNCEDIFAVDRSGILVDGRDYYLSFYRAARQAERCILISGWQFDTNLQLLRGKDAEAYGEQALFLSFLNALCARRPGLGIYILAWDYNVFFIREREWFQKKVITSRSNGQMHFLLDASHAFAGSHHQKFTIIDGKVAFAGGADICADRWDTPDHLPSNPLRLNPGNVLHGAYHEIQAYVTGPAVAALARIFRERWSKAGGGDPDIPDAVDRPFHVEEGIPIAARRVAVSRTLPRMFFPGQEPVKEILQLYLDAIASAEGLVYIENQYFSSRAVFRALADRMSAPGPRLQLVIILPKEQNAFGEEISVGIEQSKILRSLKRIAAEHGHACGIYYSAPLANDGVRHPVYIHSKVLIVDDVFLTVGSANFTNRSQRIDTELNLSWEAPAGETSLLSSIRRIRVALLAEHAGLSGFARLRRLARTSGLVAYLDSITDRSPWRLCRHPMTTRFERNFLVRLIPTFPIDPEEQILEENLYRAARRVPGIVARLAALFTAWFQKSKT